MGFVRRMDRVPLHRQRITREVFEPRRTRSQQGSATAKVLGGIAVGAVGAVGAGIGEYLFAHRQVNGATQLERAQSHLSTMSGITYAWNRAHSAVTGFAALEVPFLMALGIARLARGARRTAEQIQRITPADVMAERQLTAAPQPAGSLPEIVKRSDPKVVAVSLSPSAPPAASVSIPIPIDVSGGAPANGFKIGSILPFSSTDSYEILGHLGAGGMGKVYKVRHLETGEIQALKVLLFDNPNARSRFVREAIALRDLTQRPREKSGEWEPLDGVVGYKGFSETAGGCNLLMEYLDGEPLWRFVETLEQAYSRGTDAPTEQRVRDLLLAKLNLFHYMVLTLGEVYAIAKIMHRDLKGDNIIVVRDKDGRAWPKILDWGLAKDITENIFQAGKQGLTETGGFLGTFAYAAPEVFWGAFTTPAGQEYDRKDISIQADMYSLGVILYRTLVGRMPFDTDNYIKLHTSPQEPQIIIPDYIPSRSTDLIKRLLARDPGARPQDYPGLAALTEAAKSEISGQK